MLTKQNEDLSKYNNSLKLENDELRDRLQVVTLALSDLNQKLKDVENEKLSFVTALKILHQESPSQAHIHANDDTHCNNNEEQDYSLVNRKRGMLLKKTKEVINLDATALDQSCNVVTRNSYEELDDELLNNNNSNGPTYGVDQCASCAVNNKRVDDDMTSNTRRSRKRNTTDQSGVKHKENPTVIIVGDSLLKHLKQQKISKSTNTKTRVKSFPGANIQDMKDYIKPALRNNPDRIILHVGTNDLRSKDATSIVNEVHELCKEIKKNKPATQITISEIISREDNHMLQTKVSDVNNLLKSLIKKPEIYGLLSHNNIDKKGLNAYGLHLNRLGTSLLAKNIINHIKSF